MSNATAAENLSTFIDCYPRLPRASDSSWAQSEAERNRLYDHIQNYCVARGLEGRVTRSNPEIFPTWVRFEAWFHFETQGATRRIDLLIVFVPKPFHRVPVEYAITITQRESLTESMTVLQLDEGTVDALLDALTKATKLPRLPAMKRERWHQIWRANNRLKALRPNGSRWIASALSVLGAVGIALSPIGAALAGLWANLHLSVFDFSRELQADQGVLETAVSFLPLVLVLIVAVSLWLGLRAALKLGLLVALSVAFLYALLFLPARLLLIQLADWAYEQYGMVLGAESASDLAEDAIALLRHGEGLRELGIGSALLAFGIGWLIRDARRPLLFLTDGKPLVEPRDLRLSDYWHAVVPSLGGHADALRRRFVDAFLAAGYAGVDCRSEQIATAGPDGKEERTQTVVGLRRALVFCQFYAYGDDLYVGWDAFLNAGQWVEQRVTRGIDRATGQKVQINAVVPGAQRLTEYDVNDLNCLIEWTHVRLTELVKQVMAEQKIDREIDFKIQRSSRDELTRAGEPAKTDAPARRLLRRTA